MLERSAITRRRLKIAIAGAFTTAVLATAIALIIIYTNKEKKKNIEKDVPDDDSNSSLLQRHMPVFYADHREKHKVTNLITYTTTKEIVHDDTITGTVTENNGSVLLHYFLYYDQDGGMEVGGTVHDAHRYDLEHITVEVEKESRQVMGVLYQPHGSREHFWIRGEADLKRILVHGRRPVVYSSYSKHGSYSVDGTIFRYFGVANDVTENPVLQKYTLIEVPPALLQLERIDNKFRAIAPKLRTDVYAKRTVRLDDVRRRMLIAKFW